MSDSLILDAQVECSCDDPKDFDCVSNRGMMEEEHCDNLESVLTMDSSLVTEMDALDHDVSGVSRPSSIALLYDNHGVEEDRDVSLDNRQVPSFEEIYPLCGSDAFLPVMERDFKVLLQGNVHDRLDTLKLRKMMNSSLFLMLTCMDGQYGINAAAKDSDDVYGPVSENFLHNYFPTSKFLHLLYA
ncbi:hypothetical protein SASPL_138783 [Salvia splendens]|uniref:Uncharacterized protein n=1 Tax=Salvia splendens TaxID=180675 RepID=A0A8X8WX27_SALSN|nr:hypothetical protein SASPL_138783 [Salvia splendens]